MNMRRNRGWGTYASRATHGVSHLLVAAQGLYPQADCLELCAHLVELLDVSAGADEVLSHDLARVELAILGRLLDVCDEFLLACLEFAALAVELALGLGKRPLVLPETFCGGYCAAKEGFLGHDKPGKDGLRRAYNYVHDGYRE